MGINNDDRRVERETRLDSEAQPRESPRRWRRRTGPGGRAAAGAAGGRAGVSLSEPLPGSLASRWMVLSGCFMALTQGKGAVRPGGPAAPAVGTGLVFAPIF